MARWLVTGANGQLGSELVLDLRSRSCEEAVAVDRTQLDITDPEACRGVVGRIRPDVVINVAAWTDVDGAESREPEARVVNADGVAHLAEACRASGARLIQVSTDYVFGGDRRDGRPWAEDDPLDPRCAYARTKAAGEQAVREILPDSGAVVRTAWLYGAHGRNFVRTMLAKAQGAEQVRVVRDQWGQPTWARDVALRLVALGERLLDGRAPAGAYHATNAGQTSWWEFARWIYSLAGADPGLVAPMTTDELDRPAPRPAWSVLGHDRWSEAGLAPMRPWHEALVAAVPVIEGGPRH